ncbi:MAG: tetratricopeptide repeat protein [Bacteroidia bacterium]|nr:MAG: tetratricopeptide repeat protein [Bacteroidia bacterium]
MKQRYLRSMRAGFLTFWPWHFFCWWLNCLSGKGKTNGFQNLNYFNSMKDFWHRSYSSVMFFGLCVLLFFGGSIYAGDGRQLIREGNSLFQEGRFEEAEDKYRQALEAGADQFAALFNLGNTLYKQGRLEEAGEIFSGLTHAASSDQKRAKAFHNLGNSFLGAGQIAESIEAYKNALRISPDEEDTRYNLAYALNLLDEMPPMEQPANGDGNGEDDDEQQQDDMPGEADDDEDKGDQQEPGHSDRERQQETIDQLTHEDAERILDALRQQEQEIQEQINREDRRSEPVRSEREW